MPRTKIKITIVVSEDDKSNTEFVSTETLTIEHGIESVVRDEDAQGDYRKAVSELLVTMFRSCARSRRKWIATYEAARAKGKTVAQKMAEYESRRRR